MLVYSLDGTVSMSGSRLWVGIPNSGEARYRVDAAAGGALNVSWDEAEGGVGRTGRVVLEVLDGRGEHDELVITSPRTIRVSEDGTVALTLSEYAQVGGALSALPGMLAGLEGRIAALEAMVALIGAPVPDEATSCTGTTYPSGEGE